MSKSMNLDKWFEIQEVLKLILFDSTTWQDDIITLLPTDYQVILEHKIKDVWCLSEDNPTSLEDEYYLEILVNIDEKNDNVDVYGAYVLPKLKTTM